MFENHREFKTMFAGRELTVETGKVCGLANGSCWVKYGETVVMVNVTASRNPREGVDFFPEPTPKKEKKKKADIKAAEKTEPNTDSTEENKTTAD